MNSLTTQLLKKSKTEEGFNSLKRELQDIRSRQENNYYDYYYSGHFRDNDFDWKTEGECITRKRWERDQELIKSFNELFTWNEKFALEVEYGIGAYEEHAIRTNWEDDRNEFQLDVADARQTNAVKKLEQDEDYENFNYEDHYDEDDIGLYHRKKRTMLVKVSNFQKIEKGFGG